MPYPSAVQHPLGGSATSGPLSSVPLSSTVPGSSMFEEYSARNFANDSGSLSHFEPSHWTSTWYPLDDPHSEARGSADMNVEGSSLTGAPERSLRHPQVHRHLTPHSGPSAPVHGSEPPQKAITMQKAMPPKASSQNMVVQRGTGQANKAIEYVFVPCVFNGTGVEEVKEGPGRSPSGADRATGDVWGTQRGYPSHSPFRDVHPPPPPPYSHRPSLHPSSAISKAAHPPPPNVSATPAMQAMIERDIKSMDTGEAESSAAGKRLHYASNAEVFDSHFQLTKSRLCKGRETLDITPYLCEPQVNAATKLGMPVSTLSKRWKEAVGDRKWPFRQVRKVDREIDQVLKHSPTGTEDGLQGEARNMVYFLRQKRNSLLTPVSIRL